LLKTAIRDENPVVFFEDKMMYLLKGPVPEGDYTIPFGVADIKRPGAILARSGISHRSHCDIGRGSSKNTLWLYLSISYLSARATQINRRTR
jgi:hypothetical protein